MSRFSKTSPPRWPVARTATSTMALAKSSARITWLGNTTRKRRIDRAQQAVAEIRLPARLHRADVRRPEEVNVGETCREQRILGLSLVASKRTSDFVRSGLRQRRSKTRTLRRGCYHGERARTRSCSPRLTQDEAIFLATMLLAYWRLVDETVFGKEPNRDRGGKAYKR